ncbi:hypothetical protein MBLNU230_g2528t1 [Neophaeotheca triangularis]
MPAEGQGDDKDVITCDGRRPCSNCLAAKFPCEGGARLSKNSTPRSYVQYLEDRVRQLEGKVEEKPSPSETPLSGAGPRDSFQQGKTADSPEASAKRPNKPDLTVLQELGTHVIDEDGLSRYMGPSSGIGFSAQVLQEVVDEDQQEDPAYYALFSLDDFSRGNALEQSDHLLWSVSPTNLPDRASIDPIISNFFIFTERSFPILHRPTFIVVIDELYSMDTIGTESFEMLAQFYLALSIGHSFSLELTREERTSRQIEALQAGCRCHYATLHMRRDGLTRLQTLSLHAYALIMLRQRSEALRLSAIANIKALECGLHHDGNRYTGNPLETEMRRRIFWCTFMLHLFSSALSGIPRALHEADITIAEPSDVDDDQLTSTSVTESLPGESKIHRFISVCRLARILSRVLDVLYTTRRRKQASTKIEQMNRLCCDHLLESLDFSADEVPEDVPDPNAEGLEELATMASYANEQMLFHYVRWLIHRPGLSLPQQQVNFGSCLQTATEAASSMLKLSDTYQRSLGYIRMNPAVHPMTTFIASLTPLYRTALHKSQPHATNAIGYAAYHEDEKTMQHGLNTLRYCAWDRADDLRISMVEQMMEKWFKNKHGAPKKNAKSRKLNSYSNPGSNDASSQQQDFKQRVNSDQSRQSQASQQPASGGGRSSTSIPTPSTVQSQGNESTKISPHHMEYHNQQVDALTAQEDLRNFVHEAFSPGQDPYGDASAHFNFQGSF